MGASESLTSGILALAFGFSVVALAIWLCWGLSYLVEKVMAMISDGYSEWEAWGYLGADQNREEETVPVINEEKTIVPNAGGSTEVEEEDESKVEDSNGFDLVMYLVMTKDTKCKFITYAPNGNACTHYCSIKEWRNSMAAKDKPYPLPNLKHMYEHWIAY